MATTRQYHFLLSEEDEQSGLQKHMDGLAKKKQLTDRIKTALTLLAQLESGNTEMLDKMFPSICNSDGSKPPTNSGDIASKLERIERLMLEQGGRELPEPPPGYPQLKPLSTKLQPMFEPPHLDDDDEGTLILKKSTSTNAAQNMINSMLGLQQ